MSAKTSHSRYRLHPQLSSSVIRNYAEVSAREPMLINVNDAKKKTSQLATWLEYLTIGANFSWRACYSSSQSTSSPSAKAHGMILKC